MDTLKVNHYFSSSVFYVEKPEFLDAVNAVSERSLQMTRKDGDIVTMTGNFSGEPEVKDFTQYVSQTAWNILSSQGYAMDNIATYFTEMWTQEHNKMSSMDTHVHGMGAQVSAFYFLDVPDEGCKLVVSDPRPAKVIINMPQKDDGAITPASTQIVMTPKPGMLILTNSWLPHSFTRNNSDKPMRFVHMNLSVALNEQASNVEVL